MQNNAKQCKQCKTMQNNAKQCKTMQSNAKQCKIMQNNSNNSRWFKVYGKHFTIKNAPACKQI